MQKIAMLGSGFIGRFYTDSLHGYRNKDRVVSVYSRSEESVKSLLKIIKFHTTLIIWKNQYQIKMLMLFA